MCERIFNNVRAKMWARVERKGHVPTAEMAESRILDRILYATLRFHADGVVVCSYTREILSRSLLHGFSSFHPRANISVS